jgi:hypothetical protein
MTASLLDSPLKTTGPSVHTPRAPRAGSPLPHETSASNHRFGRLEIDGRLQACRCDFEKLSTERDGLEAKTQINRAD